MVFQLKYINFCVFNGFSSCECSTAWNITDVIITAIPVEELLTGVSRQGLCGGFIDRTFIVVILVLSVRKRSYHKKAWHFEFTFIHASIGTCNKAAVCKAKRRFPACFALTSIAIIIINSNKLRAMSIHWNYSSFRWFLRFTFYNEAPFVSAQYQVSRN